MKEEKKDKLNEIDIDNLIKSVYNKIAEWHNDDATSAGLKHVTFEIIEDCTNNTLKQIGLKDIVTSVQLDKETRDEALKQKSNPEPSITTKE
tara:strand:- start:18 stop:293 length:276 start_codon:yes stop_codon:yes gene_type:complete